MARIFTSLQNFFRHPHAYYGYISFVLAGMSLVTLGLQLPHFQPAEMLISFLPLWFFCETITLIVAFIWTSYYHRKPIKIRIASGLLLLGLLLHWGYQATLILDHAYPQYLYSNVWQPKTEAPLSPQKIRIAFFNKYYFNQEYQEISQRVTDLGIDIIGMSEISAIDYQEMKTRLPFEYSYYTNCQCKSSIGSELALFSRYPLDSVITNQLPSSPSIKATVSTGSSTFSVLILHTHAPTSGGELAQRNKTLTALGNQIYSDQSQPLVVIGDLNT
ncbi:endonuclease/exonuclease/phosphatase family protein, partial [Candidatus Gracilibacteria bacterium]|nr:endonuclease/exonuclease/phosphatase family protein [Candidatus Gracilibacteria bacterium]